MAEGVTTELLLSKVMGHLECSICCTRYNQPKNLDCSHSYCLKCLQELKKTQNPDTNKLTCPLCQKETFLPLDGVTGLQNNYTLIALVEEVNKQEQLLQGEGSKVIICQACDEENAAISRCLNCEHYLCQECQKAHQRLASLKNHDIKTLAELQEVDDTQTESKMNISRCDIHPNQELYLYCMTCEQLICKLCTSQHQVPLHKVVDIKSATEESIQEIVDWVSQLDKCEAKFTSRLELLFRRLDTMFNETKRQIFEKAENEISKIRQLERTLVQEASEARRRKGKILAKLIFAQKTMNMVLSLNTDSENMDILKNRQKHLHDFINLDEGKAEDLTHDLSFISLTESTNAIGSLSLKENWGEKLNAKVSGHLIGAFSTGCLFVVSKNEDTTVTIINPDGTASHTYGQSWLSGNLKETNSLAVNKYDHAIILDGQMVKTFGSNWQLLHQFTPGMESDSEPTCLAVDVNNLIAVGYKGKGEISLHNPDGSLIRTLSAPGIDKYMTMSNQRIIYTSHDKNALMCVSLNETKCETLFSYKDATLNGICCDKVGDIYVVYEGEPKPDISVLNEVPEKSGLFLAAKPAKPAMSGGFSFGQSTAISQSTAFGTPLATKHMPHCICRYMFGTDPTVIARSNDTFYDITYTPRGHLALIGENHTVLYQRV